MRTAMRASAGMKRRENTPNIYLFTDFRAYLNAYFQTKKIEKPAFSTRKWCQDLNLKSPATLNMILRGKRNPGQNIVEQFSEYFYFNSSQKEYFETLVKLAKAKNNSEYSTRYMERLRSIHPEKDFRRIEYDLFSAISSWQCFAIRELVNQEGFREDSEWISRRLRGKISPKKVKDSIEILLKTNFLERNSDGFLIQKDAQIGTLADTANEAIKRFHEQMIGLALDSVRSVPVEDRDISGSTFNVDPADLPALKDELRKARQEIYRRFEKPKAKATYQLNFQLFPLTDFERIKS